MTTVSSLPLVHIYENFRVRNNGRRQTQSFYSVQSFCDPDPRWICVSKGPLPLLCVPDEVLDTWSWDEDPDFWLDHRIQAAGLHRVLHVVDYHLGAPYRLCIDTTKKRGLLQLRSLALLVESISTPVLWAR